MFWQVASKDQIFPMFVMQTVGDLPGLPGLFVAGVFSGALSTVSSGLNSLAAVLVTGCSCNCKMSETARTLLTKAMVLAVGLVCFAVVFLVRYLPGVLHAAIAIFGMVGGPILGVFSLGMFVPRASSVGAITGLLSSLLFVFWWGFGFLITARSGSYDFVRFSPKMPTSTESCPGSWGVSNMTTTPKESNGMENGLYDVSYIWFGPVSTLLCLLVGGLVSLARPTNHRQLDRRLISPAPPRLAALLPAQAREVVQRHYNEVGAEHGAGAGQAGNGGAVNAAYIDNTKM